MLHVGNIYNFILTWWFVRSEGGYLALRIDDADERRTRDRWLDDIFQTLTWLGLDYDEGAQDIDDFKRNYSQQQKKSHYHSFLDPDDGRLFSCQYSRKMVDERGHYQGRCFTRRPFRQGEAVRLQLDPYCPILWRKDDMPAYHLTSVIDDHEQDISHLIRGEDLLPSTLLQRQIAQMLNLRFPTTCFHHSLLLTRERQKLSKSQGAKSVRDHFSSKKEIFHYLADHLQTAAFDQLSELLQRPFPKQVLSPLLQ